MSEPFPRADGRAPLPPSAEPRRAALASVAGRFSARLAALARDTAFAAAVDQHAAAVRERIGATGPGLVAPEPDAGLLGDYALGFLDGLAEAGWREPTAPDAAVCRLTAVARLVRDHGLLPA